MFNPGLDTAKALWVYVRKDAAGGDPAQTVGKGQQPEPYHIIKLQPQAGTQPPMFYLPVKGILPQANGSLADLPSPCHYFYVVRGDDDKELMRRNGYLTWETLDKKAVVTAVETDWTVEGKRLDQYQLKRTHRYNAFGELEAESYGLESGQWQDVTYRYNQQGRLLQKTLPSVLVTDSAGESRPQTPSEQYGYNKLGQQTRVIDANGHVRTQHYGHGLDLKTGQLLLTGVSQDGQWLQSLRHNEFGDVEAEIQRMEDYTARYRQNRYNQAGQLLQVSHWEQLTAATAALPPLPPIAPAASAVTAQDYLYDSLGNRLRERSYVKVARDSLARHFVDAEKENGTRLPDGTPIKPGRPTLSGEVTQQLVQITGYDGLGRIVRTDSEVLTDDVTGLDLKDREQGQDVQISYLRDTAGNLLTQRKVSGQVVQTKSLSALQNEFDLLGRLQRPGETQTLSQT
ncbi:hypothetical protein PZA18_23855, partial [Chitinimonas sp. DQS-5]|nr:hypothetical protein [Parachitinimonas caeni]